MPSGPKIEGRRRLTVALLVYNDQDLLPATLSSVEPIADEILLVDLGSTDRSEALGHARGARFIHHRWSHDLAAARNEGLEAASGNFVLWLEPGELLLSDDAAQLRAFVDRDASPEFGYLLWIQDPPVEPHALVDQAAQVRLVPRRAGLRYRGRVRESLLPSIVEQGLQVEIREWRIERGPHVHLEPYKVRLAQLNRELSERSLAETGPEPRTLVALGEALVTLGDSRAAAEHFRKATQLAQPTATERLEAYYGLLTTIEGDPDGPQQQLNVCLEALDAFPFDAQLLCAMGGYLQAGGRLELAGRAYKAAYEFGQLDPQTWHVRNLAEVAATCHAMTLELGNNDRDAERVLCEALDQYGPSRRLRQELLELYVRRGRLEQAIEQVDRLPAETPLRGELRTAVRGACLAAAGNYAAALPFLRAAYASRCRDPLCLRWFAAALLATGDWPTAEEVILQWTRVEPHNRQIQQFAEATRSARSGAVLETVAVAVPLGSGPSGRSPQMKVDPPQGVPAPSWPAELAARRQRVGG